MEAVTWQRDDWRRENGLPETTYGVSALSEHDPEDQHPLYFNTGRAFVEFRRLCEAGKLVAFGMSAAKGEPVPMRPMDWAFGRMEFSSKLDEVWRVGGDSFSRIMVEQSQLLAVAEPHTLAVTEAPPAPEVSPSPSGENMQNRKARAPSRQQRTIEAWLTAKGHKSWPDQSDREIADLVTAWHLHENRRDESWAIAINIKVVENWRKSPRADVFFESSKSREIN